MTANPTLHSRLRVLVAKAFRAEKLYATVNSSRADRLTNMAALAEAAGDIRAREWQRSHYQLRTALNDVLGLSNSSAIVKEVVALRDQFVRRSGESNSLVEKGADELVDTARRHEFAHIFKISIELIRHKAQAQACRVIADELTSVLDAANAQTDRAGADAASRILRATTEAGLTSAGLAGAGFGKAAREKSMAPQGRADSVRSNVVQLKTRAALGQRKS